MRVELINPFVSATHDVFQTMLGCKLAAGHWAWFTNILRSTRSAASLA